MTANLKGALKKLIQDTSAIEGTVVKVYVSQADVRPARSATLMRQVWIPKELRGTVKVNDLVRVSRTTRGLVISDVLDDFTKKNLGLIAVRQAPAAPTNFKAAVRGATIIFTWKSPGGKIAHYEILQAVDSQGTGETIVASPSGLSCALQLPTASSHYYAVRAEDIWGQKGKKSAYLQVVVSAALLNVGAEQRPSAVAFSWSQFSDVGDPEISARYKVDVYREDDTENPVESVVLDATSFLYATDVAMAFSATVTAITPNGQQLGGGASAYVEPDLVSLRGEVEITDSEGRTTDTLKVLLDNSWETGVAYDAQTWHWVQFRFTPSRLLDYLAMVADIPRVRAVLALTYDETTWQFYGGDSNHAGLQATQLGSGPLTDVETHKLSYLMLQGEEGNRLGCSYPKQLTRTARIYFYPEDGEIALTELIPDTRLVVGFLDALYEITTGGRMVARGEGGSAIQIGYWSGSESDYGIYATDRTGRPFFVLNVPGEYLRIGYPEGDKAIVIRDGDIYVDGSVLVDGTVSANAIQANTLSAIAADLGQITAGEILMGEDEGYGFTGLRLVYPDPEHPGLGIYRDGELQAILSAGGYIQFGEATIDAEGIRQPLGPGQWTAFTEGGLTAWVAGEASVFDETDTKRVYNRLYHETDDNIVSEIDSRFSSNPTQWVPMPMYHDSFGVTVSPHDDPTEFFVGEHLMGFRLREDALGRFVIANQDPEGAPLPAPLEMDTAQGELVLARGYGRVLARVPHAFLYVPPASPGTACDLLHQGLTELCMPAAGWIRRLAVFNNGLTAVTIRIYRNDVEMPRFWPQAVPIPPRRVYQGFEPNPDGHLLFGVLEHYPYNLGGETYIYTVAEPNPDAFDFMPADVIRVRAESVSTIPTNLQVWVQLLI